MADSSKPKFLVENCHIHQNTLIQLSHCLQHALLLLLQAIYCFVNVSYFNLQFLNFLFVLNHHLHHYLKIDFCRHHIRHQPFLQNTNYTQSCLLWNKNDFLAKSGSKNHKSIFHTFNHLLTRFDCFDCCSSSASKRFVIAKASLLSLCSASLINSFNGFFAYS